MVRIIVVCGLLIASVTGLKAQDVNIGLELGSNIIPIETTDLGTNFRLSPYSGVNVELELTKNIRLSSGVFFSQRQKQYFSYDTTSLLSSFDDLLSFGGGSSVGLDSLINIPGVDMSVYNETRGTVKENYIEIPINISYQYQNFNFSAGTYFGFLIGGSRKEEMRVRTPILQVFDISSIDSTGFLSLFLPPADQTTFSESSSMEEYKIFDIGFKFGVGYSMDKVRFNLNYNFGMNDYRIDRGLEEKSRHQAIRVSVVYLFWSTKKAKNKPSL